MALPEYIIASDRQVVNYRLKKITQKYFCIFVFCTFPGQAIARKMLSQEGRIKEYTVDCVF